MGYRRPVPQKLPAKLLAIREAFGASQVHMARALNFKQTAFKMTAARIWEYEQGKREPNLLVLLAYGRLADVPVEQLIDDQVELAL